VTERKKNVRYVHTHKHAWKKVSADDSDWTFDFPIFSSQVGDVVFVEQIRVYEDGQPAGIIWRPFPILTQ